MLMLFNNIAVYMNRLLRLFSFMIFIYSNPPKYRPVDKYDKIETEVKNNAKQ